MTVPVTASPADHAALASVWPIADVPTPVPTGLHQCMWVQLDSASTAAFGQSSMRRNMNIESFSAVEQEAEVSGEGYEEPADGSDHHDFFLQTFARRIVVPELIENEKDADDETMGLARNAIFVTRLKEREDGRDDNGEIIRDMSFATRARANVGNAARQFRDTVIHIWITRGYRLTDRTVTIGSNTYPLLDNSCGQFGVVGVHDGIKDPFTWQFKGKGLSQFKSGLYALKVPHKGTTRIGFRLEADPDVRPGDKSDLPRIEKVKPLESWKPGNVEGSGRPEKPGTGNGKKGKDKGGCLGLLVAMAAIPAAIVASLFGIDKV